MTEKEYKAIFNKYNFDMVKLSASIVGPLLAEDFVQESFIKLWNRRNEDHTNVRAFLFKCLVNACLNHLKKQQLKNKFYESAAYLGEPSDDYIEAKIIKGEYIKRVIEEIKISPEERKKIIILIREGLSPKEIAAELGISESTVAVQLKRFIDDFGKVKKPKRGNFTLITYNGKTQGLGKWAKELGICRQTLGQRLGLGMKPEIAFQKKLVVLNKTNNQ